MLAFQITRGADFSDLPRDLPREFIRKQQPFNSMLPTSLGIEDNESGGSLGACLKFTRG